MTDDKTRAEFEKEFPLPDDCEWDGIEAYCWVYTRAPHPHNKHWEGWQAAKARYEQKRRIEELESALQPSLPQEISVPIVWARPEDIRKTMIAVIGERAEVAPDKEQGFTVPLYLHPPAEQTSLPQDVEEWIAEKGRTVDWVKTYQAAFGGLRVIHVDDVRAFLAGKVLVPVEVIDKALTAIRNELESAYEQAFPVCCGRSGEECCGSPAPDWPEQAKATMENLGQVEKELANALTASKGE